MSKAFTSEENEDYDPIELPALPPGTKNYMTPAGHERLRAEMERLLKAQSGLGREDVVGQAQAQKIERRLQQLEARLGAASVVDPRDQPSDRVLFGATVAIADQDGQEQRWRIVGIDEADPAKGWISWM